MKIKIIFAFAISLILISPSNIFGQRIYKWVDEKGTIHFSDSPTSSTFDKDKEATKENGLEVLKKLEEKKYLQGATSSSRSSSGAVSSGGSGGRTTSRPVRS